LVETNITRMYTHEIGLSERLSIVESTIFLEHQSDESENHILVPDNQAEIIIPLNGPLSLCCMGSVRSLEFKADSTYFLMPRRRGAEIKLAPGSSCLIIKVNPIFAKKITDQQRPFSMGVFELDFTPNQMIQIQDAYVLHDKYLLSEMLEDFFNHTYDLHGYNMTIFQSIELIKESHGMISIKDIYSSLEISKSKLEQHFNKEIGLTPKEFCKVEKINHFISMYRNAVEMSLTELTYQCGYYDQSHLIKDFKYFLNESPKKFLTKNEALAQ